jgi:hypothetical protein
MQSLRSLDRRLLTLENLGIHLNKNNSSREELSEKFDISDSYKYMCQ